MQYSARLSSVHLYEFHVMSLSTASDHHLKFADTRKKKETRNVWRRLSYLGIISFHDKNRTHLNHLSSFSNKRMSAFAASSRCQGCASSSLRARTRYKNVFIFSSG